MIPSQTIDPRKTNHISIPKIPVSIMEVGTKPMALSKLVFQKFVRFISGRYICQAILKRFGPVPNIGSALKFALKTASVAPQEGRTSMLLTPNFAPRFEAMSLPSGKTNTSAMIATIRNFRAIRRRGISSLPSAVVSRVPEILSATAVECAAE